VSLRRTCAPSFSFPGRSDGWKAFLLDFSASVEYVTGQPVDVKVSSRDHDTAAEEELESFRAKVDELTNEVGPDLLSAVPGTDADIRFQAK
jgi:hypothetical protein